MIMGLKQEILPTINAIKVNIDCAEKLLKDEFNTPELKVVDRVLDSINKIKIVIDSLKRTLELEKRILVSRARLHVRDGDPTLAELEEKLDETDTKQVVEPGKFGGYLSALFDPDLMDNTLSDIKQGDEMGERMQFAEDRIGDIGKKILYVLGNNADSVNDLYNHPNKDILLAEVRQVFIYEGGLDENSGDKELESIIAHHIRSGK
jgi:hypothetical protein